MLSLQSQLEMLQQTKGAVEGQAADTIKALQTEASNLKQQMKDAQARYSAANAASEKQFEDDIRQLRQQHENEVW